jgi:hypothetical protein
MSPQTSQGRWLLLIHQIPPKPNYFRVKIWRRLQRIGAIAVKNSVYVLPKTDQSQEDFQWLLREIVEGRGDASICEANFIDGLSNEQVEAQFQTARDADYGQIVEAARKAAVLFPPRRPINDALRAELEGEIAKLRQKLAEIVAIDFFGAPGRDAAEGAVRDLEARVTGRKSPRSGTAGNYRREDLMGKTWVTRRGIHVDRMASAWLIRRFIDPEARFKFVSPKGYKPLSDEVRFDMFEAEFTHEGDNCSFEVLLQRVGLSDGAFTPIAQIVHDIDLKDAKFGRDETTGIERLIAGIAMAHKDDEARLARGAAVFDDLYEYFKRKRGR